MNLNLVIRSLKMQWSSYFLLLYKIIYRIFVCHDASIFSSILRNRIFIYYSEFHANAHFFHVLFLFQCKDKDIINFCILLSRSRSTLFSGKQSISSTVLIFSVVFRHQHEILNKLCWNHFENKRLTMTINNLSNMLFIIFDDCHLILLGAAKNEWMNEKVRYTFK